MDVTNSWRINKIKSSKNKKHWRTRFHIKEVEKEIGALRVTAIEFRGTGISKICNRNATRLEQDLKETLS